MATIIIDGREVEIAAAERLNGIQAARLAGVEIPHYCWHPGLSVVASCRMCLVESGRRDPNTGEVSMMPKLVPACQTPAVEGSVFVTNSEKVQEARAMVEEDLLIDHPIDCPICDKAGECRLQDYHFAHGQDQRRADIRPFTSRKRVLGDTVTLFVDRCVMCTRCTRFCREITGTSELMVTGRGAREEIDVFPGYPLANKMSGNVVDLCPVGALGDRDFLYKQRVWFLKQHDNVCAGCSTGCSIRVEENQDQIYRLTPRENPHVNQWWMCDEGRYGWKHVHSQQRQTQLRRRDEDVYTAVDWTGLPKQLNESLTRAGRLAVALSPHLTVEEAYLLATYIRGIDPTAVVAVGPVPEEGADETFPNGFTIRAQKCPNYKGVAEIATRVNSGLVTFNQLLEELDTGQIGGLWVSGGYKSDWIDTATAERIAASAATIVVQDAFASPLWDVATYQLPGGTFAERQGSYVNFADRLQTFTWAIRPPTGVMVEGQLYWRLLEKPGLYQPRTVLDEIARRMPYFSAAAGPIPAVGVDLKVNQLAAV